MAELNVVKETISTEAGFTEGQVLALRKVFEELTDMIEEQEAQIEELQSLIEVH